MDIENLVEQSVHELGTHAQVHEPALEPAQVLAGVQQRGAQVEYDGIVGLSAQVIGPLAESPYAARVIRIGPGKLLQVVPRRLTRQWAFVEIEVVTSRRAVSHNSPFIFVTVRPQIARLEVVWGTGPDRASVHVEMLEHIFLGQYDLLHWVPDHGQPRRKAQMRDEVLIGQVVQRSALRGTNIYRHTVGLLMIERGHHALAVSHFPLQHCACHFRSSQRRQE